MKRYLQQAARVTICLAIVALVWEAFARSEDWIRYGAPLWGNYTIDTLYEETAAGKFGRPNASYLKWHLNDAGFRGPALREQTYRIVCMGSSETFGLYESPSQEWPRQLETILNADRPGAHFEVVNTAYPGLSTATSLRRLPWVLSVLQPRMVVIYPSYAPYISIHRAVSPGDVNITQRPPPLPARERFQWRMAGRLETLLKAVVPERVQHWLRSVQLQRDGEARDAMDRVPEANVQAFATDLGTLTTRLQERGIRVVLVTHANRFGASPSPEDRPYLTDWRKFYPSLGEDGFLDMEQRMSDAVRTVAREHHAPVVDAATIVPPGKADFVEFVHFTDKGAHILASSVAEEIEREAGSEVTARVAHETKREPAP